MVRGLGKPHLFITVTSNPAWPEIINEHTAGQTIKERLGLCLRVFKIKLNEILRDLTKSNIFGLASGWMYSVDFQERGLPHAHILLVIRSEDTPQTSTDIDMIVSAELPDPDSTPIFTRR